MDKNIKVLFDIIWKNLCVFAAYLIIAKLSTAYLEPRNVIIPIISPIGIAFVGVLCWGYRVLLGIWLAVILRIYIIKPLVLFSIIVASGDVLQVFTAVWLLLRLTHTQTPFYNPYHVSVFILGSAVLVSLINPTIGTTSLFLFHLISAADYSYAWLGWWFGDMTSVIFFGSVIMVWYHAKLTISPKKIFELILLAILFSITAWFEFAKHWPARLLLIYSIWAAIRFNPQVTTMVCAVESVLIYHWSLHGHAAFQESNFDKTVLFTQTFIAVIFFTALIVAAAIAERERARQELITTNIQLESRVKQRTQDLAVKNKDLAEKNSALQTAMQDLKQTQAQLVQAEKMSALGVLTAGIAHEINNSVNFISANITPLKNDIDDLLLVLNKYHEITNSDHIELQLKEIEKFITEINLGYTLQETQKLIAGIQEGAQRTTAIVKNLRTFSRLDEGGLKTIDIHQNIDSTLNLLNNFYKDRIVIVKNYGDVPEVECYPGKVNQVIMNLLTNAIQAIPEKGEITITTQKENDQINISIKDSGNGMSEKTMAQIFEPFFTTKEVGKGTGLGLSISYNIIQEHHGKILVNSELGKGSEFIISLPLKQPLIG